MADTVSRTKINKVYVVGTVQEVNVEPRTSSTGRDYVSGKIVVKTEINNIESLIEMRVLAFAKTNSGEDSKVYASYLKLDGYLGKRVRVTGDLREGSMVNQNTGGVNHFNEIYVKFVNPARNDDIDCATFEYSGFVVKGLYERKNKEDELLGYRLEVGQANYNNTSMQVLRFDVDKNDLNIASIIESNYTVGSTVNFSGTISYISHTETRTEEVAFGDPIVKTFVVSEKTFRITGGNEPFSDEDPATYTQAEIKKLVEAYKAADVERVARASGAESVNSSAATPAGQAVSKLTRASSLI